jgi:hypothetical protein
MRRRNPSSNSPSKSHAFHAKEIPSTQNQRSAVTLHQRRPNRPLVHTSSPVQRVFWNGHPLSGYTSFQAIFFKRLHNLNIQHKFHFQTSILGIYFILLSNLACSSCCNHSYLATTKFG